MLALFNYCLHAQKRGFGKIGEICEGVKMARIFFLIRNCKSIKMIKTTIQSGSVIHLHPPKNQK